MTVLSIDPGSEQSGVVVWAHDRVVLADVMENAVALSWVSRLATAPMGRVCPDILAIENVGHYGLGMPAGKTVFDTCVWIGRFLQAWSERRSEKSTRLVLRPTIKTHLCGKANAKDPNVRRAVLDRLGEPGTKKKPGVTYGVKSHSMQALALALYVCDTERIAA